MKKFVFLAHGEMARTPEFQSAHRAWWSSIQGHVVDSGNPLFNGRNVSRHREVTELSADESQALGYSIVQAESIDEAVALLAECPMDMWVSDGCDVAEIVSLEYLCSAVYAVATRNARFARTRMRSSRGEDLAHPSLRAWEPGSSGPILRARSIVVVPDPDALTRTLRRACARLAASSRSPGSPGITRPRKKYGTVRGFSVVDPGGNWLRSRSLARARRRIWPRRRPAWRRSSTSRRAWAISRGDEPLALKTLESGLTRMVQYASGRLDASFAALSDATRRGVLERLGRADASITDLARDVPHDPHGHEEARRRPGAGGARHHGEGRARADLPARRRADSTKRRHGSSGTASSGTHASTSWTRSSRN